jgi:hypothetical protein
MKILRPTQIAFIKSENNMSHIVEIKTEVRDANALRLACQRLGLAAPVTGKVKLFNNDATGEAVQLPHWRYPVVFDLNTGQVKYDNYEGHWGEPKHLDRLLQAYAVERASLEARRMTRDRLRKIRVTT